MVRTVRKAVYRNRQAMIRNLFQEDIPDVLHLMQQLRIESPTFGDYPEDAPWVQTNLRMMISSPVHIMLFDEKSKGVMFGFTGSPWWSPYYEANEMLLAIPEVNRGGSVAVRLIKEFERIAECRACRAVNVGSSLGINDDRAVRLYEALGYTRRGHGLTKRI